MYHKLLVLFMLSVYVQADGIDPQFRYDYKYYEEANGWLKLHFGPMSWQLARAQCYYEGAVLATPLNQKFRVGISRLMQDRRPSPEVLFSGVSASFAPGVYTSVEGVPLDRLRVSWSENEPTLTDGCVVFYANETMASKPCGDNYPFICYKKYEQLVVNECGTVDNRYRYDNETKKCYKYHPEKLDWSTAYKVCQAEGAYLTTNLTRTFGEYELIFNTLIPLGSRYIHGSWWEIDGTLAPFIFNIDGQDYVCGGRQINGLFDPYNCSDKRQFICEKAVDSLLPNKNEGN